jgi:nucleotide-binding universal stress UspA family protein
VVKRILIPLDLTALGEAKLPVAQEYALAFDADVILLHVLPPRAMPVDLVSQREASARAYLDVVAAGMTGAGVRAVTLLRTGTTAASIVEEAREQQVDLIVLGANVRPVLRTVVIGSIADEVVRTAHCPVLLVRPQLDAAAPEPLRSFADDAARAGPLRRRSLGVRTVEVGRIIGTVGRARELGRDFHALKRRKSDEERLQRIKKAMEQEQYIPPIELYKLGFGYYVLDGHHRVAVAHDLDMVEIDAEVTEFVPIADPEAARTFAERRAFERSTGLHDIGAVHPESYGRLHTMVDAFRDEHQIADYREAANRWYGQVYRQLWHVIRERRLTRFFPGDRSADFVARVGAWQEERAERGEPKLPWLEALDRFAEELAAERGERLRRPRARAATDEPPPEQPDLISQPPQP